MSDEMHKVLYGEVRVEYAIAWLRQSADFYRSEMHVWGWGDIASGLDRAADELESPSGRALGGKRVKEHARA